MTAGFPKISSLRIRTISVKDDAHLASAYLRQLTELTIDQVPATLHHARALGDALSKMSQLHNLHVKIDRRAAFDAEVVWKLHALTKFVLIGALVAFDAPRLVTLILDTGGIVHSLASAVKCKQLLELTIDQIDGFAPLDNQADMKLEAGTPGLSCSG